MKIINQLICEILNGKHLWAELGIHEKTEEIPV